MESGNISFSDAIMMLVEAIKYIHNHDSNTALTALLIVKSGQVLDSSLGQ